MSINKEIVNLTPQQFEQAVERSLRDMGAHISNFEVQRLEKINSPDGEYEIDVSIRFEALGANYLTLVECKQHRHPIKRDVVMVMYARLQVLSAQKGMIFSTSPFQKGAVEYAKVHNIALVRVMDGRLSYINRSEEGFPDVDVQEPCTWMIFPTDEDDQESTDNLQHLIYPETNHLLSDWLTYGD